MLTAAGDESELDPGLEGYSDSGSDFHDLPAPLLPDGLRKALISPSPGRILKRPQPGDEVVVHVVLALANDGKEVFSTRRGGEPLRFVLGRSCAAGLQESVPTMRLGEVSAFTLSPAFLRRGLSRSGQDLPAGEGSHELQRQAHDGEGQPHCQELLREQNQEQGVPVADRHLEASTAQHSRMLQLEKAVLESAPGPLLLELELVDWLARTALVEDGSVIKRTLRRPDDHRRPIVGQECVLACKVFSDGELGTLLQEWPALNHRISDGTTPQLLAAASVGPSLDEALVDRAILSMKRGELAALECRAQHAFAALPAGVGPETPVRCELQLLEFLEDSDASFERDGSVLKRSLECRDAWAKCEDAGLCTLSVLPVDSSGREIDSGDVLRFTLGDGEVCDALECAAASMRRGELASFVCSAARCDPRLGDLAGASGDLHLRLRVLDYAPGPREAARTDTEKLELLASRKDDAVGLFRAGRHELAAHRFRCIYEALGYIDDYRGVRGGEARKLRVAELKRSCLLNRALCCLKAGLHRQARTACDVVLEDEPSNAKALFRRAQAHLGSGDLDRAMRDARAAAELEPGSAEARQLVADIRSKLKADGQRKQPLYAKMCGGLGNLPHPLDVD